MIQNFLRVARVCQETYIFCFTIVVRTSLMKKINNGKKLKSGDRNDKGSIGKRDKWVGWGKKEFEKGRF